MGYNLAFRHTLCIGMSGLTIRGKTSILLPVLRKRLRWILTGLVASIILVLSLIPQLPDVMGGSSYFDKLEHFAAYFVLGLLLFLSVERGNLKMAFLIAAACCFAYGAIIEFFQRFTQRQPEFWDLIADLLGALVGALVGALILRSRRARSS
jgi:VanZ family protein